MRFFILYIICLLLFLSSANLSAQDYKHSIGIKVGSPFGITYKGFMNETEALEAMFTFWPNGPRFTGLYERQKGLKNPKFAFYYGAGAHVQLYSFNSYGVSENYKLSTHGGLGFGIEAVVGLEYKMRKAPFLFDLNFKPNFEFTIFGESVLNYDPSITFRYMFGQSK